VSKFSIGSINENEVNSNSNNKEYYYILFKEEDGCIVEDMIEIADELNIPVEKCFEICEKNGGKIVKNITDYPDAFENLYQAQSTLQELLEFAVEYNKYNNEDDDVFIPLYPDDFFDYSDGKEIADEEINDWIKECITDMEEDFTVDVSRISCGDSTVIVLRKSICDECDAYVYDVIITNDYMEFDGSVLLDD
jgi:hypothetical protein